MAYYENLSEVCNYLQTLFTATLTPSPLESISMGRDTMVMPTPPAAIMIPGEERWTLEASQAQAVVDFSILIYLIHGNLAQTRGLRSYQDLALASDVRDIVRHDWTLGGHVLGCWVSSMVPRRLPAPKQAYLLGTELTIVASSRATVRMA